MIKTEIIPVIHMINQNQVLTNVKTCVESGVSKVFIINHQSPSSELIKCASYIKGLYPDLWVGVNMLDVHVNDAILYDFDFDGLWCDQTLSVNDSKTRKFRGMLFTGLAFKYQPQPSDIETACKEAIDATVIPTTSGAGTGKEANLSKILTIRRHLSEHPMAIASGVNADNIVSYKGVINYLLVASSITSKSEIIDKDKLKELLEKIL
jgi:phosphoribosylanthranilate isomerase